MGLGGLPQDNKGSKGFRACVLRSDYPGWILDSVTYHCVTLASLLHQPQFSHIEDGDKINTYSVVFS